MKQTITLALAGDLIIGSTRVYQQMESEFFQAHNIIPTFDTLFGDVDATFLNFEGTITNSNNPRDKNMPAGFTIRSLPTVTKFLKEFTEPVFSLANNHIADFGWEGIEDTMRAFKDGELRYVGVGDSEKDTYTPRIVNIEGYSIAFFAFTDLLPEEYYAKGKNRGVARLHEDTTISCVREARDKYDKIIVSLHTVFDRIDAPLSFWPDAHQRTYYRQVAEAGADIVVGHQPHGIQYMEKYHNAVICYSLGALIYNPNVSNIYSSNHLLYNATQFRGGCVVKATIKKETGATAFSFHPTICRNVSDNEIQVVKHTKMLPVLNLLRLVL